MTFGLSLRAGRRRVSPPFASRLCRLPLWATPLTENSSPNCFRLANPTSSLVGLTTLFEHKKADCLSRLWLRRKDLNQWPSGYEPDELPDCSTPRYLTVCFSLSKIYYNSTQQFCQQFILYFSKVSQKSFVNKFNRIIFYYLPAAKAIFRMVVYQTCCLQIRIGNHRAEVFKTGFFHITAEPLWQPILCHRYA